MKDIIKAILIIVVVMILGSLWSLLINKLLASSSPEYPVLRERLGTILWHSSDKDGVFLGSYNDPNAVDHIYCYYPKSSANSKLIIRRQDNGDCSNWYGKVIFREAYWVSEREKYQWN